MRLIIIYFLIYFVTFPCARSTFYNKNTFWLRFKPKLIQSIIDQFNSYKNTIKLKNPLKILSPQCKTRSSWTISAPKSPKPKSCTIPLPLHAINSKNKPTIWPNNSTCSDPKENPPKCFNKASRSNCNCQHKSSTRKKPSASSKSTSWTSWKKKRKTCHIRTTCLQATLKRRNWRSRTWQRSEWTSKLNQYHWSKS